MIISENEKLERDRAYSAYLRSKSSGHFQAWVVRLTGARGSGKSLVLASMACTDLAKGVPVWSNMKVTLTEDVFNWNCKEEDKKLRRWLKKEAVGRQTLPLDWDAFYSLSEDLAGGTVCIDEAQYFSDSRSALSLKNRLLNAIVAQVRKRNLNLYYTVKQGDWIDKRLSYETDIEVQCEDTFRSDWAKARGVPPGEMIMVRMFDLSGAVTGHATDMHSRWARSYRAGVYRHMHKYWGAYDTSEAVDLEEAFTSVKLDLKQRVITNKQPEEDVMHVLGEVAEGLASKASEVSTVGFWNIVKQMGVEGSPQRLGRYLPALGITRKQRTGGSYYYDLSHLHEGGII
jgi:Zonular occludens toxin (Zot).